MILTPPFTSPSELLAVMRRQGYAVLGPEGVSQLAGCSLPALDALRPGWDDLPPDAYLRDGGRYRRRRHSCFVIDGAGLTQTAHRAHWQPVEYNALHGGMERWFEPMKPETVALPAWQHLLLSLGGIFSELKTRAADTTPTAPPWYVEAHQFRIDTTDGIGRPTPEGAHRDGVDFVAVMLVGREGIKGGETRVFEAASTSGQRFTMTEPWTVLLLDDERVIHESTPILPTAEGGHRDTLVLTYRTGGFQGA